MCWGRGHMPRTSQSLQASDSHLTEAPSLVKGIPGVMMTAMMIPSVQALTPEAPVVCQTPPLCSHRALNSPATSELGYMYVSQTTK